ncbi:GH25 family lysozyme [Clostridium scatologenes]|uniref:Cell wall hydrolase n=1 Tax=Clostridium scatologenes TaxID=1548 RepID=A0A0E3JMW0_CLOSL|nr:GH25 family lysozyme [Clostridium scatologenes]AKA68567.1 cell wall hydrolase [Clostridium scatologenes]
MKGIDIYEGDNIQDWNAVKNAGIEVVIQKASQGTSHVDKLLNYRYPLIRSAGLKIGFYHFASYNSENPIEEAQHFLDTIAGLESDTVLWLDIEAAEKWGKQTSINYANAFIDYVGNQGHEIGIYTGDSFFHSYLKNNIPDVPLWIASYGRQPNLYPDNASWQYTDQGQLNGIVGNVDLDYFIDNIFIKREDEMEMENIVGFNNQVDKRAAEYLADFLNCPTVDLVATANAINFSKVKNVYFVGGGFFPQLDNAKVIKGPDRYDTCIEVMKNIGKLK